MTPTRVCELYIDGASRGNPGPGSVGVVVCGKDGKIISRFSHYLGETTNNAAEYLALIYGLLEALRAGCRTVAVKTDSELLARQINGQYKVRDGQLRMFFDVARHLTGLFRTCHIAHIPRESNVEADRLAGQAVKQALRARAIS